MIATSLLSYAETEITRLGLGTSLTNCHGVAAYEVESDPAAVRLSDGAGLNVVCRTTDDVDAELSAMADWYASNN